MAFDCGFDIFPHLVPTKENKILYRQFLDTVLSFDTKRVPFVLPAEVDCPETYSKKFIYFLIPGQPKIPLGDNGDCFLGFRSNDAISADVLKIVEVVAITAREFFGSRVHFWKGQSDIYSRGELHRAEEEVERRPGYILDRMDDIGTKDEPGTPAEPTEQDV
jgi:hypothetical protein